ncbi:MAG: hypothetical protein ACYTG1_13540 [Planctomycetota bacterium]|jgi:hypothetical protein
MDVRPLLIAALACGPLVACAGAPRLVSESPTDRYLQEEDLGETVPLCLAFIDDAPGPDPATFEVTATVNGVAHAMTPTGYDPLRKRYRWTYDHPRDGGERLGFHYEATYERGWPSRPVTRRVPAEGVLWAQVVGFAVDADGDGVRDVFDAWPFDDLGPPFSAEMPAIEFEQQLEGMNSTLVRDNTGNRMYSVPGGPTVWAFREVVRSTARITALPCGLVVLPSLDRSVIRLGGLDLVHQSPDGGQGITFVETYGDLDGDAYFEIRAGRHVVATGRDVLVTIVTMIPQRRGAGFARVTLERGDDLPPAWASRPELAAALDGPACIVIEEFRTVVENLPEDQDPAHQAVFAASGTLYLTPP